MFIDDFSFESMGLLDFAWGSYSYQRILLSFATNSRQKIYFSLQWTLVSIPSGWDRKFYDSVPLTR